MKFPLPLSAMLEHEPLTTVEALNLLVRLLQIGLITWGVWLMSQSNAERKADTDILQGVSETLRTHTHALRVALERMDDMERRA